MEKNYEHIISQAIEHIMEVMKPRVSPEELHQIEYAYQIA